MTGRALPMLDERQAAARGGALHVADALSEPVLSVLGPALAALQA